MKYLLLLCASVLLLACSSQADREAAQISGEIMGTRYAVTVVQSPDSQLDIPALSRGIQEQLAHIDALMSTYKPDSEVSRLSALPASQSMRLHPDTYKVLTLAQGVFQHSGGAFDPTVGPLVDLWGFGSVGEHLVSPPNDEEIRDAKALTGFQYLVFEENERVDKKHSVRVDLSAIAKGYAVDSVAEFLRAQGVDNYLVEVGGEIATFGRNARLSKWVLGIEQPDFTGRRAYTTVQLSGEAMATSGDYRNYFEFEGKRYAHTIDPRSGAPAMHRLASVSVIHEACALADAWSTALMVLGEKQGLALAEKLGLKAYFIYRQDNRLETVYTTHFEPYLTQ